MKNRVFDSTSPEETYRIAATFFDELRIGNVVVLEGDLGVGKTEFVRAICRCLKVTDIVTSPTFTLINQYDSDITNIYHIDLYRIKNRDELLELGFVELFADNNSIFFIEWAENSFSLIPNIDYKISIKHNDNETTRIIEIISMS